MVSKRVGTRPLRFHVRMHSLIFHTPWTPLDLETKSSYFAQFFATLDLSICILLYVTCDALGNLTRKCEDTSIRGNILTAARVACACVAVAGWRREPGRSTRRAQIIDSGSWFGLPLS